MTMRIEETIEFDPVEYWDYFGEAFEEANEVSDILATERAANWERQVAAAIEAEDAI